MLLPWNSPPSPFLLPTPGWGSGGKRLKLAGRRGGSARILGQSWAGLGQQDAINDPEIAPRWAGCSSALQFHGGSASSGCTGEIQRWLGTTEPLWREFGWNPSLWEVVLLKRCSGYLQKSRAPCVYQTQGELCGRGEEKDFNLGEKAQYFVPKTLEVFGAWFGEFGWVQGCAQGVGLVPCVGSVQPGWNGARWGI